MDASASLDRCVLFADVAASTRLYQQLGDQSALRAVELCLRTAAKAASVYRGQLVKTIGDEIMVVFPSAEDGVLAACEIQQRIAALPPVAGNNLEIRVGCHWGPVIAEGGDFFGDTVNTAARLVQLAKARQVLTCADTLAAVPPALRPQSRRLEALTVQGRREGLPVEELFWQDNEDSLTVLIKADAGLLPVELEVSHDGQRWHLDADSAVLTLGRDPGSDVVIRDGHASRSHARIERRHEHFVLVDCSTNGTFVFGADGVNPTANFLLRREEAVLRGSGRLSFGQVLRPGVEYVAFRVEE